jgi:sirohydrochlorin ferrochelatase
VIPRAKRFSWWRTVPFPTQRMRYGSAVPFAQVEAMTVRDDAPAEVRAAEAAELRAAVTRLSGGGKRILIVPLLLSYGGIEAGS